MTAPSGNPINDVVEFVQSWKTNAVCDSHSVTRYQGACSRSFEYEAIANSVCKLLKSGKFLAVSEIKQEVIVGHLDLQNI